MIIKKTTLLIATLLLSLYAIGQRAPSSEVVNASLPKGAKLLTKDQLITYTNDNYKRSQISKDKKKIYQLDGLLISFWDLPVMSESKKSLQASQSEILEVLKWNKENTVKFSKIITVNSIQFLVYEYQVGDEVFLRFQSEYNKNDKNICGLIQFKSPDEDKAQAALQTFLESVHFKE